MVYFWSTVKGGGAVCSWKNPGVCVARSSCSQRVTPLCVLCLLWFPSSSRGPGRVGMGSRPTQTPFPNPAQTYPCIRPGSLRDQLGMLTLSFTFTSSRVAPFLVFGITGPKPTPISYLICFVCHSWCLAYRGTKSSFHLIFTIFIIVLILPGPLRREKIRAGSPLATKIQTFYIANATRSESKCTDHSSVCLHRDSKVAMYRGGVQVRLTEQRGWALSG